MPAGADEAAIGSPRELRGHVGAVGRVRRPDAVRADIAEAVERDAIDTAECRAHGGVDRKQLLIRRRRLAVAEHDAVELAHQHKIEVDQRAAVVGYEDAGNGNAGVAQKTEDIDLLRHLPLQLGGVDLEDAAWRVSPRDLEDRADLAAA
ncbi:hypothetical protein ACVIHH_002024 [Bradyrhizobium sp. USDA 4518]|nr:hypothetical protein [Bradyrhizobium sp. USDA 4545]MCP1917983.1 hypothetical protein [Bradyrhizobium sp. USDA 4532]